MSTKNHTRRSLLARVTITLLAIGRNFAERLQQISRQADALVDACSDVPKQADIATFA